MRILALLAALAGALHATKPCGPDTWFAKKDRKPAEWAKLAKWVAVAKVTAREENVHPYVNCYAKDRSQCAMDDDSIITVKVLKAEKGEAQGVKRLRKSYCAPDPPKKTGERYRFYGLEPGSYIFFEKVPR